jgi:hypothetical protein
MTQDKNKIESLAHALLNDPEVQKHTPAHATKQISQVHLAEKLVAAGNQPYLNIYPTNGWYDSVNKQISLWVNIINPGPTAYTSNENAMLLSTFFGPLPTDLSDPSQAPMYRDTRLPLNSYGKINLQPYSYSYATIVIPVPEDYPLTTKAMLTASCDSCLEPSYGVVLPVQGDTIIGNFMLWNIKTTTGEWPSPTEQTTVVYDLKSMYLQALLENSNCC